MKKYSAIVFLIILAACNTAQKQHESSKDSLIDASDNKVENILQNDDSLIKAKEKELLEKYK